MNGSDVAYESRQIEIEPHRVELSGPAMSLSSR